MNTSEIPTNYPLQWPTGWKRTPSGRRTRSRFRTERNNVTLTDALNRVEQELRRWGIHQSTVSCNVEPRLDGRPRSGQARPSDPGVAVYFRLRAGGRPKVFACDRWITIEENLAAIAGHIAALRTVERYGVGETEQVLAGYTALPPTATDWRSMFGFGPDATPPFADVERRYLERIKIAHPDRADGNPFEAARLNEARDLARHELGG